MLQSILQPFQVPRLSIALVSDNETLREEARAVLISDQAKNGILNLNRSLVRIVYASDEDGQPFFDGVGYPWVNLRRNQGLLRIKIYYCNGRSELRDGVVESVDEVVKAVLLAQLDLSAEACGGVI